MEQPNGQQTMSTGRATYPPAYNDNAPGPHFDRATRSYIRARLADDPALTDLARNRMESAIRRIERGA